MQTATPGLKRQPPRLLIWAVIALIGGIVVYFQFWQARPDPDRARRASAIPIIAAELARLPPAGGVAEAQRTVITDAGSGPSILVVYPQVISCSEILAHYAQAAAAVGWMPYNQEPYGSEIIVRYRKVLPTYHDYPLVLSIDCTRDDAAGESYSGYTLWLRGVTLPIHQVL